MNAAAAAASRLLELEAPALPNDLTEPPGHHPCDTAYGSRVGPCSLVVADSRAEASGAEIIVERNVLGYRDEEQRAVGPVIIELQRRAVRDWEHDVRGAAGCAGCAEDQTAEQGRVGAGA